MQKKIPPENQTVLGYIILPKITQILCHRLLQTMSTTMRKMKKLLT